MKINKKMKLLAGILSLLALSNESALASTSNATINATLTVTGTCGFSQPNYTNTNSASAGDTTIPVVSTDISYNCSSGYSPTLTATNISVPGTGSTSIGLGVYNDPSATIVTSSNPIALIADGTNQTLSLYLKYSVYSGSLQIGVFNTSVPLTINY